MAQNPNGMSLLDPGQIIKRSYDPDNDAIRVDAQLTFDGVTQEVIINKDDDSIEIYGVDPSNVKKSVRLSENGEITTDGTYDASLNTNPANIGLVTQERNVLSSDSRQTQKPTSIRGSSNTTDVSLDTSLHDGSGNRITSTGNALDINIKSSDEVINSFNSISAVASGISTSILLYTVPVGMNAYIQRAEVSGTNIAAYEVYINGILSAKKRTYFGGNLNQQFEFDAGINKGLKVLSTQNIEIMVLHNRPDLGDFEARLQLILTT